MMKVFKRISCLALCILVLAGVISVALKSGVELGDYKSGAVKVNFAKKTGDVNSDGYVDKKDVTYLAKQICKELVNEGSAVAEADVNKDGEIDMRDYVKLKKMLGLTPSRPTNWTDPEITPPTPED